MRIAVFHNLLSGGAKRSLQEAAKRLATEHTLHVYTLSGANHEYADLRPYAASHRAFDFRPVPLLSSPFGRVNQLIRTLDLARLGRVAQHIAAQLEHDGADVAFVHPCQVETSPSLLHYLGRVPAVYYCQEPPRRLYEQMPARPYTEGGRARQIIDRLDPLPGLYRRTLGALDRRNLRRATQVLVNSEYMRRALRGIYGVEPNVSYLGVDNEQFRPMAEARRDFYLSVGSLTPLKGFDFLIRAVARLPEKLRWPLVIASNFHNPPERQYLEQLSGQLSVELRLEGNVTEDCLVQLYNQARLTLYAPVREPFGLVALESLACGTPVVAVREGGVQETVMHEEVGMLTEREPGAFAEAVAGLAAQPERAAEFGRRGRELVRQRWTWDQAATRIEAHLTATAAGRHQAGLSPPG